MSGRRVSPMLMSVTATIAIVLTAGTSAIWPKGSNPGCILFLLDRSESMREPFGAAAGLSLAQGAANAVNRILFELCLRSQKDPGQPPRHYFDVGVLGYGVSAQRAREVVEPAFAGPLAGRPLVSITELATNPLDVRQVQHNPDLPPSRTPVWFDPLAGMRTPMCQAVAMAGRHLAAWVTDHPTSYPPIVINITDGVVTDSPYKGADLPTWVQRLTTLETADGRALLFNIFLSRHHTAVSYFPSHGAHLPAPGPAMFDITSVLPQSMALQAKAVNAEVAPGARGLVFNADAAALAAFLDIGTRLRVVDH